MTCVCIQESVAEAGATVIKAANTQPILERWWLYPIYLYICVYICRNIVVATCLFKTRVLHRDRKKKLYNRRGKSCTHSRSFQADHFKTWANQKMSQSNMSQSNMSQSNMRQSKREPIKTWASQNVRQSKHEAIKTWGNAFCHIRCADSICFCVLFVPYCFWNFWSLGDDDTLDLSIRLSTALVCRCMSASLLRCMSAFLLRLLLCYYPHYHPLASYPPHPP